MECKGLKALIDSGADVVLVSQGLDHVMRPLARHLGAKWVIANRLEFRDGIATGRLLDPVIRPRGVFARITGAGPDGRRTPDQLVRDLGLTSSGTSGLMHCSQRSFRRRDSCRRWSVRSSTSMAGRRPSRFRFARRWRGSRSC